MSDYVHAPMSELERKRFLKQGTVPNAIIPTDPLRNEALPPGEDTMVSHGQPLTAAIAVETKPVAWHPGEPPKPWRGEWFIAQTTFNDRVVLRALPDEWTYDYTTADETYIKADKIKAWMQFPDSSFKPYETPPQLLDAPRVKASPVTDEMVVRAAKAIAAAEGDDYMEHGREFRRYASAALSTIPQIKSLEDALSAILAEPFGCPFCDSGKLRNPNKDHESTCGYYMAQQLVSQPLSALQSGAGK